MTTMAPTRPAALPACRVRLTPGPAAAAEARTQIRGIGTCDVPGGGDVAFLFTSELVTNAIRHAMAGAVTADTRQARGEFRADVHDTVGKGQA